MNVTQLTRYVNGRLGCTNLIHQECYYDREDRECYICKNICRTYTIIGCLNTILGQILRFGDFELCQDCLPSFFILWMIAKDIGYVEASS